MNVRLMCVILLVATGICGRAWATFQPSPVKSENLWANPAIGQFLNKAAKADLAAAQNEAAKSNIQNAVDAARMKGIDSAIKQANQAFDLANKALQMYQTLSQNDKGLDPDYKPPGAPDIPSQCMEDGSCRVCFGEAQEHLNTTRINLEKVRRIYEFTNKLAKQGEALMQGVGSMAGGHAAIAASVQTFMTEESLKAFNGTVKAKNQELLGKVEKSLREISTCEAKFYKNDSWFDRYGYMYYQFMLAHYGY